MGRYTTICNLDHRKNKNISSFLVFAFHLIIQHDENFPGPFLKIIHLPLEFSGSSTFISFKGKEICALSSSGKVFTGSPFTLAINYGSWLPRNIIPSNLDVTLVNITYYQN